MKLNTKVTWYYNGPLRSEEQDGHSIVNVNLISQFHSLGLEIDFYYYCDVVDIDTEKFVSSLGVSNITKLNKNRWFKRFTSLLAKMKSVPINNNDREGVVIFGSNTVLDYYKELNGSEVLLAGDVESRKFAQKKNLKNMKIYIVSKLREYVYRNVGSVVLYSDEDSRYLSQASKKNLFIHPVCYKSVHLPDEPKEYDAIFTGNFNYSPNMDAANFITRTFANSDLKIALVGFGASKISISGGNNFIIKDGVESIEKEILKSNVFISPLSIGTGVKNKILAAINCGIPVLATDISLDGIPGARKSKSIISVSERELMKKEMFSLLSDILRFNEEAKIYKEEVDDILSWKSFSLKLLKEIM